MPVNLSIKNAPDEMVRCLKDRAKRHHRSLQGEMLSILDEAVHAPKILSSEDILAKVHQLDLHTPSESAAMVRADRDGR